MTLHSGRAALHGAITRRTAFDAQRLASTRRGYVVSTSPLQVKLFGYDPILTYETDFEMTQWALTYHQTVGLRPDDVILMHSDREWLLFDIVTDTPVDKLTKSGGSSQNRISVTTTFSALTTSVETQRSILTPGQASWLYTVHADQQSRVRVYATTSQATADISRAQGVDPGYNAGCLLELAYISSGPQVLSPTVLLVEQDAHPTSTFPAIIRCDHGTVLNVTVTGYVLQQ